MISSRPIACWALSAVLLCCCRADFVDERPLSERSPAGAAAASDDLRGADLYGLPLGPFATGSFSGRAGHLAVGGASLYREDDGRIELRFDAQFQVSPVPGPLVVLTRRGALGTMIDPAQGDLTLGPLTAPAGAQSYPVHDLADRRYAFVFCLSYGLEVGRATLLDGQ